VSVLILVGLLVLGFVFVVFPLAFLIAFVIRKPSPPVVDDGGQGGA
jgi:hypothetical protein